MNFRKMAEQKIDELSGKITKEESSVENVDLVLEGLDDVSVEDNFEFEIIEENTIESDVEKNYSFVNDSMQQLFDGYLGEKSETPNPLEYGPNATYRNLKEGIVYKKGPDNLWEVFLQDGKHGRNGQSVGSGIGVNEAKLIIDNKVSNGLNLVQSLPTSSSISLGSSVLANNGAFATMTLSGWLGCLGVYNSDSELPLSGVAPGSWAISLSPNGPHISVNGGA